MKVDKTKFIFVSGGVYSSLGKGISASSMGRLLKEQGFKVAIQKLDPYLNANPLFLSPLQHGEIYITKDGRAVDLDLGNYERFIDEDLTKSSSLSFGRIYSEVLENEKNNVYKQQTIQVVPTITNHIIDKFYKLAEETQADFIIVEIGGTVGDIESIPFFETLSIFAHKYGKNNVLFAHCVPLIALNAVNGELKTKPAQHSINNLRSLGVQPDFLILRSSLEVPKDIIEKISYLSAIDKEHILVAKDLESTYFLPTEFYNQNFHSKILSHFKIDIKTKPMKEWDKFVKTIKTKPTSELKVAIVGEYVSLHDAYFSVLESINLTSYELKIKSKIVWISADDINKDFKKKYDDIDIFIFGGFASSDFKKKAELFIDIALKNNFKVLSYSEGHFNVLNYLKIKINSNTDLNPGSAKIELTDEAKKESNLECHKERRTKNFIVKEEDFKAKDFKVIGKTGEFVEIISHSKNDLFCSVNFNPEFTSRPMKPNLLYLLLFNKALNDK